MTQTLRRAMLGLLPLVIVCLLHTTSYARADNAGFIYGTITTNNGNSYTGIIRWGTEESFWDDLFNSTKTKNPNRKYLDKVAKSSRKESLKHRAEESSEMEKTAEELSEEASKQNDSEIREKAEELKRRARELKEEAEDMADEIKAHAKSINIFGGTIQVNWNDWGEDHQYIIRFGDIKKLKIIGSEDAEVMTKDNEKQIVSGGSNDLGEEIVILDNAVGQVTIPWKKIDNIVFSEIPSSVTPPAKRLYGTVSTDAGDFQGFIQWDCEECQSVDKLDGDSEDGRMSIPMGSLKSIERKNSKSVRVEMKDGRKLVLRGTNDVDETNRGIMVEDPRFGRVTVPFNSLEKVEFESASGTGKAYTEFIIPRPLRGTVTDDDGKTYHGRIVYDVDETYTWEMLNGENQEVQYCIPFTLVKSVSPKSEKVTEVKLQSGVTINLEGSNDVDERNSGILIFTSGDNADPKYIDWKHVKQIDFE